MKGLTRHIGAVLLLSLAMPSLTACYDVEGDRKICDYRVQLRYYYNRENTSAVNVIDKYVYFIDEYIFDDNNVLYAVNRISPDPCGDGMWSQLDLPPGRYSVISWGNHGDRSCINDCQIGVTTREQLLIYMDFPCVEYPGYQDNGDRLFYGYRTFTVEDGRPTRIRVDITHAHLSLRITVRWSSSRNAPLAVDGSMQMRLSELPSEYMFLPEYVETGDNLCHNYDPVIDDDYPAANDGVIHFIPHNFTDRNVVRHSLSNNISVDRRMEVEFVTFRLRNGSRAVVSLYQITTGGDVKLMNDVPLGDYFARMGEDLDLSLRQEYALELIIGDDQSVTVIPADMSDWDEGGSLGYD